jgi:N-methylhydantoinase B
VSAIDASAIDPVTLAVVQSGLQQVCNEMDLAFVRSAFSPVISEALDRSDGIYAKEDGALIAQGELGLPVFVGTMQFSTRTVIERASDIAPGDIFAVNDPYLGGTHLMDVRFHMPFFYRGELFAWLSNTGHWPDTGGMVPGGFSAHATEVEQEGLRLPPVKLYKRGTLDQELLSILLSNMRIADQRIGDIKAQSAALFVGERRLTALLDKYGADLVNAVIAEMRGRAAQQMRARIDTIPDGDYHGAAYVDSDGVVNEPLKVDMKIRKESGELHFDMSGSSPPCQGPMNSVLATTKSAVYLAIKHIFPEVPINAGTFEPLHIADPEGTFLYAKYPRPVSGCAAEVSQRIAEAVFDALAPAIPERLFAAPAGTSGNFALGGYDPARERGYVLYFFSGGGYGGSPQGDGLTNGCSTIGISKSQPVEVLEQRYPVLFDEYSLHEGSGGAGEHRGGFGINYTVRLRRGTARASMVMDHGRFGPNGMAGGAAGGVNRVRVARAAGDYIPPHLSKDQGIALEAGDCVHISTPGGGGYGDARQRDPESVLMDVRRGYYTPEEAERLFAVKLAGEPLAVDAAATAKLRSEKV